MLKPLIRTLDGWRFELPLALVLGAAFAFATIAMPEALLDRLPGVAASGVAEPIRIAIAALGALVAGFLGYRAMRHPWGSAAVPVVDEDESDEPLYAPSPVDGAVRLRRADSHPDFPPRQPIRASRDLGEPFMDVVGFADADATPIDSRPIPDADYIELPAFLQAEPAAILTEAPAEPVPSEVVTEEAAPVAAVPDEDARQPNEQADVGEQAEPPAQIAEIIDHPSIAAFTPEPAVNPAPRPDRPRRESLAEMMERLSAGLERRAGRPVAPPPADMLAEVLARPRVATPELRDALDELNRLAGRRG